MGLSPLCLTRAAGRETLQTLFLLANFAHLEQNLLFLSSAMLFKAFKKKQKQQREKLVSIQT
jgi:hypothetical protein